MAWIVVTPPSIEQISLTLARSHLNIDASNTYFDYWLSHVGIPTAREWCEEWSSRAFAQQTVELALDAFGGSGCNDWNIGFGGYGYGWNAVGWNNGGNEAIELPKPPVRSIESVKYIDTNGIEQTLSPSLYVLDAYQEPSWILPAEGTMWPLTKSDINAVKIRTINGYNIDGDSPYANPLPHRYLEAMLLVLGHHFRNRENASQISFKTYK